MPKLNSFELDHMLDDEKNNRPLKKDKKNSSNQRIIKNKKKNRDV